MSAVMSAQEYLEAADQVLADVDRDRMSLDLQSIVATYEHRKGDGDEPDVRGLAAHARAVVRRAGKEGLLAPAKPATVAELKAELDSRGVEYPSSAKKADLEQLLADDDAAQE